MPPATAPASNAPTPDAGMDDLVAQFEALTHTGAATATAYPPVTAECTVLGTMLGTEGFDDAAGTATAANTDTEEPEWKKHGWTWEDCDRWKAEEKKKKEDAAKPEWTDEEWRKWHEWKPEESSATDANAGTADTKWQFQSPQWADCDAWEAKQKKVAWKSQNHSQEAKAHVTEFTAGTKRDVYHWNTTKTSGTPWPEWTPERDHKFTRDMDMKRSCVRDATFNFNPGGTLSVQNPLSHLPASQPE